MNTSTFRHFHKVCTLYLVQITDFLFLSIKRTFLFLFQPL